ncbi:MAG: TraR/DksA family transcriptional regulator [bacterium]|nr:TraR/DksA family transcriptional regulator [bacterium]
MAHLKTNPKIKLPKPSKEELEKSIKEIGYRNTDRKYGVCDNTSRRWAMAYGIELVAKCVLKTRKRKETIKKNGRLVYKADGEGNDSKVSIDKEKVKSKTKSIAPKVPVNKKEKIVKIKRTKKEKFPISEEISEQKKVSVQAQTSAPQVPHKYPTSTEQATGQATGQVTKPDQFPVAPVKVIQHQVINSDVFLGKIKNRYSSAELSNFEANINKKIKEAVEDIFVLKETLSRTSDNGTDDTAASGNVFEDGTGAMERENLTELLANKQSQLNALKNSLIRIGNGTYGICVVTGNLIPKERLLAVPHTTKCVEAKKNADNGKLVPVESGQDSDDADVEFIKPRKFSLD